jgi:hypothetical protein
LGVPVYQNGALLHYAVRPNDNRPCDGEYGRFRVDNSACVHIIQWVCFQNYCEEQARTGTDGDVALEINVLADNCTRVDSELVATAWGKR